MVSASDRYVILNTIGDGGAGVVYRVEDRVSGEIRAMKIMPRRLGRANLRGEFLALSHLRHPNLAQSLHGFNTNLGVIIAQSIHKTTQLTSVSQTCQHNSRSIAYRSVAIPESFSQGLDR